MPRRDTDPYGNFRFKLELDNVQVFSLEFGF